MLVKTGCISLSVPEPNRLLSEDHAEVDQLRCALMTALDEGDAVATLERLDLFWARLAMHIRAEHLHLFPKVLQALEQSENTVSLEETQNAIQQLRRDHDFFMHELASAIQTARKLDPTTASEQLREIRARVVEVEKRLAIHNHLEENGVYIWAKTSLDQNEQAALARLIKAELTNLPLRFAKNAT